MHLAKSIGFVEWKEEIFSFQVIQGFANGLSWTNNKTSINLFLH